MSQAPQWLGSLVRSTQPARPHWVSPAAHVSAHRRARQRKCSGKPVKQEGGQIASLPHRTGSRCKSAQPQRSSKGSWCRKRRNGLDRSSGPHSLPDRTGSARRRTSLHTEGHVRESAVANQSNRRGVRLQAFLTALGVAASLPSPKGQVRAAVAASAAVAWIARQVYTALHTALGQPSVARPCTQKGTSEEHVGAVINQSNRRVVRMQAFLTALGVAQRRCLYHTQEHHTA